MPHPAPTPPYATQLEAALDEFADSLPEIAEWMRLNHLSVTELSWKFAHPSLTLSPETVAQELERYEAAHSNGFPEITSEEHESIFDKMRSIIRSPKSGVTQQELGYLEQQLSDLLGIGVTRTHEGISLPHLTGKVWSGAHLPRHHQDSLELHDAIPEAGIAPVRPFYDADREEQYFCGVQLAQTAHWVQSRPALLSWYREKKVLLVNPFEYRAVVCTVLDHHQRDHYAYQFTTSPEASRMLRAWSPKTSGMVFAFFVQDSDAPLGPLSLDHT